MNNYSFWDNIPEPWDGRPLPRHLRHQPFDHRRQPRDANMHNRLYENYGPDYRNNRDALFWYNGGWTGGLGQYRYRQQQQRWMLGEDNLGRPPRPTNMTESGGHIRRIERAVWEKRALLRAAYYSSAPNPPGLSRLQTVSLATVRGIFFKMRKSNRASNNRGNASRGGRGGRGGRPSGGRGNSRDGDSGADGRPPVSNDTSSRPQAGGTGRDDYQFTSAAESARIEAETAVEGTNTDAGEGRGGRGRGSGGGSGRGRTHEVQQPSRPAGSTGQPPQIPDQTTTNDPPGGADDLPKPKPNGRISADGVVREPQDVPEAILAPLRASSVLQGATRAYNTFLHRHPDSGDEAHNGVLNIQIRDIIRIYQYEDGLIPLSALNGLGAAAQAVYDELAEDDPTAPPSSIPKGRIGPDGVIRQPRGIPQAMAPPPMMVQGASAMYNQYLRSNPNMGRYAHNGRANADVHDIIRIYQYEDGLIPLEDLDGGGLVPQAVHDAALAELSSNVLQPPSPQQQSMPALSTQTPSVAPVIGGAYVNYGATRPKVPYTPVIPANDRSTNLQLAAAASTEETTSELDPASGPNTAAGVDEDRVDDELERRIVEQLGAFNQMNVRPGEGEPTDAVMGPHDPPSPRQASSRMRPGELEDREGRYISDSDKDRDPQASSYVLTNEEIEQIKIFWKDMSDATLQSFSRDIEHLWEPPNDDSWWVKSPAELPDAVQTLLLQLVKDHIKARPIAGRRKKSSTSNAAAARAAATEQASRSTAPRTTRSDAPLSREESVDFQRYLDNMNERQLRNIRNIISASWKNAKEDGWLDLHPTLLPNMVQRTVLGYLRTLLPFNPERAGTANTAGNALATAAAPAPEPVAPTAQNQSSRTNTAWNPAPANPMSAEEMRVVRTEIKNYLALLTRAQSEKTRRQFMETAGSEYAEPYAGLLTTRYPDDLALKLLAYIRSIPPTDQSNRKMIPPKSRAKSTTSVPPVNRVGGLDGRPQTAGNGAATRPGIFGGLLSGGGPSAAGMNPGEPYGWSEPAPPRFAFAERSGVPSLFRFDQPRTTSTAETAQTEPAESEPPNSEPSESEAPKSAPRAPGSAPIDDRLAKAAKDLEDCQEHGRVLTKERDDAISKVNSLQDDLAAMEARMESRLRQAAATEKVKIENILSKAARDLNDCHERGRSLARQRDDAVANADNLQRDQAALRTRIQDLENNLTRTAASSDATAEGRVAQMAQALTDCEKNGEALAKQLDAVAKERDVETAKVKNLNNNMVMMGNRVREMEQRRTGGNCNVAAHNIRFFYDPETRRYYTTMGTPPRNPTHRVQTAQQVVERYNALAKDAEDIKDGLSAASAQVAQVTQEREDAKKNNSGTLIMHSDDGTFSILPESAGGVVPTGYQLFEWEDLLDFTNDATQEREKAGEQEDSAKEPGCNLPQHASLQRERDQAVADLEEARNSSAARERVVFDSNTGLYSIVTDNSINTGDEVSVATLVDRNNVNVRDTAELRQREAQGVCAIDTHANLVADLAAAKAVAGVQNDLRETAEAKVVELSGRQERKVVLSPNGEMSLVEANTDMGRQRSARTMDQTISFMNNMAAANRDRQERLRRGDCGHSPHQHLMGELEAARASEDEQKRELQAELAAHTETKALLRNTDERLETAQETIRARDRRLEAGDCGYEPHQTLIDDLQASKKSEADTRLDLEGTETSRRALDQQLKTTSNDLREALADLEAARQASRVANTSPLAAAPAYVRDKEVSDRELAALRDELATMRERLARSTERHTDESARCNDPDHEDLQNQLLTLQQVYEDREAEIREGVAELQARVERAEADIEEQSKRRFCVIPEHAELENERDGVQSDYNSLYDYTYTLQQSGWALINHLNRKPADEV